VRLFRTERGVVAEHDGRLVRLDEAWDSLMARDDLFAYVRDAHAHGAEEPHLDGRVLAPIAEQEVWAAGVTYVRSRAARMEESRDAGGGSFYDRIYDAQRPELFFKSAPWRVRGPGDEVRIRRDARWSVPEPEIALVIDPRGHIIGYTIGNDMSSRDIEGENPLYLPQAKIYDGSCALGPALLLGPEPLPPETPIEMTVTRRSEVIVQGSTTFGRMRRDPAALVEYLYRETSFPDGCMLLTGTGVVPADDFTLCPGDQIRIHVPPIGTLSNVVSDQ